MRTCSARTTHTNRARLFGLVAACALFTILSRTGVPVAQQRRETTDWPAYGGNAAGTRFSPLNQIDKTNVGRLHIAWQFDSREGPVTRFQAQPIVVDGI